MLPELLSLEIGSLIELLCLQALACAKLLNAKKGGQVLTPGSKPSLLIRQRSLQLWEGLQRLPGAEPLLQSPPPAGLVSFTMAGQNPDACVRWLGERNIWLRSLPEPACLRACTHISTDQDDLQRLLDQLRQL